jgi:HlyD family secretion protein
MEKAMRNVVGPCLLLAGVLVLLAGCSMQQDDRPRLGEVDRLPRLETVRPERTSLVVQAELPATVEAMEKADLCAQVRGVVKSIPDDVDIGRPVHQGEALISLDIPDLLAELANKKASLEQARNLKDSAVQALNVAQQEIKEAQAQLKRYEAEQEKQELAYLRVAELAKSGTVQPQLADEARLARDGAQAALKAAQALVLTKQARELAAQTDLRVADSRIKVAGTEVERLEALVGFGTIRAPFDGVITRRWVDRGAAVKDAATPLLTVMRTNIVRIVLDVPERDTPLLRASGIPSSETRGNRVVLRMPALQDAVPHGEFQGRVTLVASALDPATRTMRAEVHLQNKAGLLRPQMTGTATLVLGERLNVLTVPSSALTRSGSKMLVYYLAEVTGSPPHGVVRKTEVEIGLDDGRHVEIRRGLTGNEQVVAKGSGVVHTGERAIAVPARKIDAE